MENLGDRGHVSFHERWKVKVNTTYRNLVLKSFLMNCKVACALGHSVFFNGSFS